MRYKKKLLVSCIIFLFTNCIVPSAPYHFNYKKLGGQSLLALNKKVKISPQLQALLTPKGDASLWATFKIKNLSKDTLNIHNYDFKIVSNKFYYKLVTASLVSAVSAEYNDKIIFDAISESTIKKKSIILPPQKDLKLIVTFVNTTPNVNKKNFEKLWVGEKLKLVVRLNESFIAFTFEAKLRDPASGS